MTTRALYCEASGLSTKLPLEAARLVRLSLEGPGSEVARVTLNLAERAALAAWLLSPAGSLTLAPTAKQDPWEPAR